MSAQVGVRMRLRDGRELGYARWGPRGGAAAFFFHGTPGSRLFVSADEEVLRDLGLELVSVERPGYGLSDPQPGRTLVTWVDDVIELAEHLGFGRFGLVGVSGGGPYVAATAWRLGDRITRAAIVSGMGPLDDPASLAGMSPLARPTFALARRAPSLVALAPRLWPGPPERFVNETVRSRLPTVDRDVLAWPVALPHAGGPATVGDALVTTDREAFRRGGRAWATDLHLLARPWPFRLEEVDVPVRLWHGDADRTVPVHHGRRVAARLPNCHASFPSGEGHYLLFTRWREIMSTLVAS